MKRHSSVIKSAAFFQPSEWDAKTYARNSTPQTRLAMEIMNRGNWFTQFIAQYDGAEINILDLGCGNGAITAQLARGYPNIHITGLDRSQQMIEQAQSAYQESNLHFICQDASNPDLPQILGRTFDCVLSFSTIHWIEDQAQLVENIQQITNPLGITCLMFYQRDNYLWETIERTAQSEQWRPFFPHYETPYYGERPELKALLEENGVMASYDTVCQSYPSEGRARLRDYLSGISPIYSSLEHVLHAEGKEPEEIEALRLKFLDDVISNLTLRENETFVEKEDGSSTFHYERVVFRGTLTPQMKLEDDLRRDSTPQAI